MRIVLPHGEDNLDRSAANLIEGLSKDALLQLETSLTKTILTPRGGLTSMSGTGADLVQHLANPLMDQASLFLAKHLPSEDVTAVEFSAARGNQDEMAQRMSSYIRGAEPLTGGPLDNEKTYLLHPDSEAGYSYASSVRQMLPTVIPMPIHGSSTDLLFCREQSGLRSPDLCQLLEPCWESYQQSLQDAQTNPHSRHDVNQWLPLVE
jgi:eukaryotic-like serine/threonine-protein kinase